MRGFNCKADRLRRAGYQKHHLIPVEVYSSRAFEGLFVQIRTLGFDPRDFSTNGIWLPATEKEAWLSGLPLHRGPHPHYSMLVRESIHTLLERHCLRKGALSNAVERAKRVHYLQGSLRRALSLTQPGLNRIGQDMDAAYSKLAADYGRLASSRDLT